jgi:hypothetical protein
VNCEPTDATLTAFIAFCKDIDNKIPALVFPSLRVNHTLFSNTFSRKDGIQCTTLNGMVPKYMVAHDLSLDEKPRVRRYRQTMGRYAVRKHQNLRNLECHKQPSWLRDTLKTAVELGIYILERYRTCLARLANFFQHPRWTELL